MGVYALEPSVLELVPDGRPFDFPDDDPDQDPTEDGTESPTTG